MTGFAARRGLVDRMIGAALLQGDVYEEVEHDPEATAQAALVVVLGAVAAGLGVLDESVVAFLVGIVAALIGWALYAYVAYWVGTRWFRSPQTEADWGQLLRTLGFATTPRVLLVLGIVPGIGALLGLIVLIWVLVTTVVAIRHALDLEETWPAIATAVISWLALVVGSLAIGLIVGALV